MTKAKKPKNKVYGTSGGVEITDELLDKWAADFEANPPDIETLRRNERRGRRPIGSRAADVFQVRLEPELREALDERAKKDGTTPSELCRRILRKGLGV